MAAEAVGLIAAVGGQRGVLVSGGRTIPPGDHLGTRTQKTVYNRTELQYGNIRNNNTIVNCMPNPSTDNKMKWIPNVILSGSYS